MGPTSDLNAVEKIEAYYLCLESNYRLRKTHENPLSRESAFRKDSKSVPPGNKSPLSLARVFLLPPKQQIPHVRPAVSITKPVTRCVTRALSPEVKWPERESLY